MVRQAIPNLDFITRAVRMPSIPSVFSKVSAIVSNPSSSVRDIAKAIETDQAISAKALQISNSAAFGLRSRVNTLEQACSALGALRVRSLVLQTSLIQSYHTLSVKGFDLDRFWRHTVLTGIACREISKLCQSEVRVQPEEAYICGLLHDIGIVIMLDSFPQAYLQAIERSDEESLSLQDAELQIFGFNHAEAGAALAQHWKFPQSVAMAARWHHDVPVGVPDENICLLVALCNAIAESIEEGSNLRVRVEMMEKRACEALEISEEQVFLETEKLQELAPTIEV